MPKLPSLQGYGLAQAGTPQPQLAPDPQGLGAGPEQAANMAMRTAMQPNPLQQASVMGTDMAEQIMSREDQDQKREDALARSLARTDYFMNADELFSKSADSLTSKEGFEGLVKGLGDLRQKSIENYKGSDEGRQALAGQLAEAHSDYFRRALTTRQQSISAQIKSEAVATTNRLASQSRETPALLDDKLAAADAFIDDIHTGMSSAERLAYKTDMHSEIAFSAVEGLAQQGDFSNAEAVFSRVAPMMTPVQQGMAARQIRAAREAATRQPENWEFGPDGVYRNKMTGEQRLPGPEIQQYYANQKRAGGTNVTIGQKNESSANEALVQNINTDLKKYQEEATLAQNNAARAEEIDKLLEGIPTGTFPAEAAAKLSGMLGINQDQLSNIQAAQSLTTELALQEMRKVAPVSDTDRRFIERAEAGFWQTPQGRKTVVYLAKRQSQFATSMEKASRYAMQQVADQTLTPARAAEGLSKVRKRLHEKFTATFDPPKPVKAKE